jgi:hypothetical protein
MAAPPPAAKVDPFATKAFGTSQFDETPQAMGLGVLRDPKIRFKRKFRWTLEIRYCGTNGTQPVKIAKEFCKTASRPQIAIDETEINYLNGKMFLPGKATIETITVSFYDISGPTGEVNNTSILGWVASVYNIFDPVNLEMGQSPEQYEGAGRLTMYDGCGKALEGWIMSGMWPNNVNFGELDMSDSGECTVDLTIRYREVLYRSFCPPSQANRCGCAPCG